MLVGQLLRFVFFFLVLVETSIERPRSNFENLRRFFAVVVGKFQGLFNRPTLDRTQRLPDQIRLIHQQQFNLAGIFGLMIGASFTVLPDFFRALQRYYDSYYIMLNLPIP